MSNGKVLLGLLAGVAAGATLGVLYAPDKGSSTRKKIVNKKDSYTNDFKRMVNDSVNGLSQKFEHAKEEAGDLANKAKEKYGDSKWKADNKVV